MIARHLAPRYAIAVGLFALAAILRGVLMPVFGSSLPYITFYPAIMISAWYGGLWPGVLTTVLGGVTALALWPAGSLGPASTISTLSVALFLFNGASISGLTELLHRARRRQDELHEAGMAHEREIQHLLRREHELRTVAEAANRAKDDFLATLSHELRTPLTAIIGWVSVLRAERVADEPLRKALDVIARNAHMQAQLVNDLLDVSRIVAGKLSLETQEVDLLQIVEDCVERVHQHAASKSLQLSRQLDEAAGIVRGDSVRLQQVVSNLLSNAVKFTGPGGVVEVRLELRDGNARIVIRDTGEGIDAEDLPRIFGRFEQGTARTGGRREGLGLGLAICRHLVEAHGGAIRAESPGKGQGATFTVDLPLLTVRVEPRRAVPGRRGSWGTDREDRTRLDGVRVLVVDSHDDARESIGMVLGQSGADVRLAASLPEALEALSGGKIDVLVSDIGLPQADGYALIRRVRAIEREAGTPRVPAVAVTAYGSTEERERAQAAGFEAHLVKPVVPEELRAVIARLARPWLRASRDSVAG